MKKLLNKITDTAKVLWKDERGSLDKLAWVLGATVVTVLVIVLLMQLMPNTTRDFFNAAVGWLRGQFNF